MSERSAPEAPSNRTERLRYRQETGRLPLRSGAPGCVRVLAGRRPSRATFVARRMVSDQLEVGVLPSEDRALQRPIDCSNNGRTTNTGLYPVMIRLD